MGLFTSMRFDNYMPPKGYMIDHGKMNMDLAKGLSKSEVQRNALAGKYNKPIPDYLKPYHKNA